MTSRVRRLDQGIPRTVPLRDIGRGGRDSFKNLGIFWYQAAVVLYQEMRHQRKKIKGVKRIRGTLGNFEPQQYKFMIILAKQIIALPETHPELFDYS